MVKNEIIDLIVKHIRWLKDIIWDEYFKFKIGVVFFITLKGSIEFNSEDSY